MHQPDLYMCSVQGIVWVLAQTEMARLRVCHLLVPRFRVCWRDISSIPSGNGPGVVVIVAGSCSSEFARAACAEARRALIHDSTVLVADLNCENARAVREIWDGEVVWYPEVESRLARAVKSLLSRDIRTRVHTLLARAVGMESSEVQKALRRAFLDEVVPISLDELARSSGLSLSKFRRACKEAGFIVRAEAILDLAILCHAFQGSAGGRSLNRLA
jgi:hypothetical protein